MTTDEQQQSLVEIGQKIVDLLGNELDAKGMGDLQFVIDILVSVTAYYLAGIADENIREDVYKGFGQSLRKSVVSHVEAGKAAAIHVFDTTKPN